MSQPSPARAFQLLKTLQPCLTGTLAPATNMAFMHTPVTHGSGVMIVTRVGSIRRSGGSPTSCQRLRRKRPAHQADEHPDAVDRRRGGRDHDHHVRARTLPSAVVDNAFQHRRGACHCRDPPSSSDGCQSAINSDKTGTLTMNRITAVEVLDPTDRYEITCAGYSPEGHNRASRGHDRHARCHSAVRCRKTMRSSSTPD